MAYLINDLATYIIANTTEIEYIGYDIFLDFMPDTPDKAVTIYEIPGLPPIFGNTDTVRNIQVRIRDNDYDYCKDLAHTIFNLFKTSAQQDVQFTSDRVGIPYIRNVPTKLLIDEKNRTIFFFNLYITTRLD